MKTNVDKKIISETLDHLNIHELVSVLIEMETNRKDVEEIKDFLRDKSEHSIRTAIIELNNEIDQKKVNTALKKLTAFDKETVQESCRDALPKNWWSSLIASYETLDHRLFPADVLYRLPYWLLFGLRAPVDPPPLIDGGGVIIDGHR